MQETLVTSCLALARADAEKIGSHRSRQLLQRLRSAAEAVAADARRKLVRSTDIKIAERQLMPLPAVLAPPPPCPRPPTPMAHKEQMEEHMAVLRTITEQRVQQGYPRPRCAVLCERSAQVASWMAKCGIDVCTCDLIYESDSTTIPHYRGDALDLLAVGAFEIVLAFVPCTYLSNAQTRYLTSQPDRWPKMERACELLQAVYYCDAEFVAIENPKMSPYYNLSFLGKRD